MANPNHQARPAGKPLNEAKPNPTQAKPADGESSSKPAETLTEADKPADAGADNPADTDPVKPADGEPPTGDTPADADPDATPPADAPPADDQVDPPAEPDETVTMTAEISKPTEEQTTAYVAREFGAYLKEQSPAYLAGIRQAIDAHQGVPAAEPVADKPKVTAVRINQSFTVRYNGSKFHLTEGQTVANEQFAQWLAEGNHPVTPVKEEA